MNLGDKKCVKPDFGPWIVRRDDNRKWRICSENFEHDVELIVTGDFADESDCVEYAADIARRLSTPSSTRALDAGTVKAALVWGMHTGVVERGDFERIAISGTFNLGTVAEYLSGKISAASAIVAQGPCETTLTPRFQIKDCACGTYDGNLGPCLTWWEGAAVGRCVYCDHGLDCHVKLSKLLVPSEKHQADPKNANSDDTAQT